MTSIKLSDVSSMGEGLNHIITEADITKDSVIVDLGANVGQFIEWIRLFSDAKIFAIEPSVRNCQIMRNKNFKNVEIIEKAIVGFGSGPVTFTEFSGEKNKEGYHKYHQWSNTLGNHKKKLGNDASVRIDEYEVPTLTLNGLFDEYNIQTIDYLKMDVEGTEYSIFESLDRATASKIKQISIESIS